MNIQSYFDPNNETTMRNYSGAIHTTLKDMARDLRNPMTIHKIQDALCAVQGDTMIREIIRNGAAYDLAATIKMIKDQIAGGHRVAIVDIIGEQTVTLIESI